MQKLISESEYRALQPGYDPGMYASTIETESELRRAVGVDEKEKFLEQVLSRLGRECTSLLDIGCGMGGYLLAARDLGLDAYGIEPSLPHSQKASQIAGLNIVNSHYQAGLFGRRFDVVMLSHVIEHIYDPRAFLNEIANDLCEGGLLIVITPNQGATAVKATGRYWSMYKPADHVLLFTKRALEAVSTAELQLEHVYTSEWAGEFAALLASAAKSLVQRYWRQRQLNETPKNAGVTVTVTEQSLHPSLKVLFAIVSAPMFLLNALLDRRACLVATYRKASRGGLARQSAET